MNSEMFNSEKARHNAQRAAAKSHWGMDVFGPEGTDHTQDTSATRSSEQQFVEKKVIVDLSALDDAVIAEFNRSGKFTRETEAAFGRKWNFERFGVAENYPTTTKVVREPVASSQGENQVFDITPIQRKPVQK